MKHYETKENVPEKYVSESVYHGFRYTVMKGCVGIIILGALCLFFGYVYRNTWEHARAMQGWGMLGAGIAYILFFILGNSMNLPMRKMTYDKFKGIVKNEVAKPFDLDRSIRKQVANTLFKTDDSWSLFPSVYKGNPSKKLAMVLTGPGGVYIIDSIVTDPNKKGAYDPQKPMGEGKIALDDKLDSNAGLIIIFRRDGHKKRYKCKNENIKLYSFQELNAFITHRTPIYSAEDLKRINNIMADLTGVDLALPVQD